MRPLKPILCALLALPLLGSLLFAESEGGQDPRAEAALAEAVKRGEEVFKQGWKPGAKACFACHSRGPNRITSARLKAYPQFDKALARVVTVQEKFNQMIESKSGGAALPLGSADLTALEAYISTLK